LQRIDREPLMSILIAASLAVLAVAAERPNVVLIFTDDQGTLDMGVYGAPDLETPHLDALAEEGVRFSQFYAAAPVCSPSRAALLTGRYPQIAGMPSNAGHDGMPQSEVTLGNLFQEAGYATANIGKWHLGHSHETTPNRQGFDHFFGHLGGCIDNYSHFFYWAGPNRHDLWKNDEQIYRDGEYFPRMMVDEALEWVDGVDDQPFFLYFALNTPHYPYQGSPEWLEHYREQGVEYPRDLYNAFLSTTDEHIGRLIAGLEARGLRENTIIVFQSDHGHSVEERAHFAGGYAGPYRGAKFGLFEGGIRVPAFIVWPGRIPAGEVRDQMAHGCDWFPTLAALTGIDPPDRLLNGRNLEAVLHDAEAPSPHEVLHWQFPADRWAVREGDWKLLKNPRDPTGEDVVIEGLYLVNLAGDPGEQHNLAGGHPEIVERMLAHRAEFERMIEQGASR